jgi:hypothetical protein
MPKTWAEDGAAFGTGMKVEAIQPFNACGWVAFD